MLLLSALADHLEALPEGDREPVQAFTPRKIRNEWLTNPNDEGDRFYKLILSNTDRDAMKAVIRRSPAPEGASRVTENYLWFKGRFQAPDVDLVAICRGLRKLMVVDVRLNRADDNPQLVFETMNSTGKELSQADKIRNYVLMGLLTPHQTRLYEDYWSPMEQLFAGPYERRFDEFVRHYLILKMGSVIRWDAIYDVFKEYDAKNTVGGSSRDELVVDLCRHAQWFAIMAFDRAPDRSLRTAFKDLEQLKATPVYPFLLRVYGDYSAGLISAGDLLRILKVVTSYLFRRAVCTVRSNPLNKIFAGLAGSIDPDDYVRSIEARLVLFERTSAFPTDEEFRRSLITEDLYNFQRKAYLMRKLENEGRKEEAEMSEYTIEHIMPQNPNLSAQWRNELGSDWRQVQERYLHTLGNLTLTGYNTEYSDKPFQTKRDMNGGFRQSPLRLNAGLAQLDKWDAEEIEKRADVLSRLALEIWPRPQLGKDEIATYQARFTDRTGFDWSRMHDILRLIPRGRWTAYSDLAAAVDTKPQPLANHLARGCAECTHPFRVLTVDGQVASGFAWTDPDDQRDPSAVLQAEGIRFSDGSADPSQRLGTEQLLALLDE